MVCSTTERWIWNAADERAAAVGCRFNEARGQHFIDFCEQNLVLWEGDFAGQPMRCTNWQYDCLMRVFGWERLVEWRGKPTWVRRFRKSCIFVGKKNKKSPTGAAVGLYLLTYDGEPGAQVYSAAKDGKQAGIVHRHAQKMVKHSPRLANMLVLNKTTGRLVYETTDSFYGILSADNIRSQEGLNGSVVIDEVHVVDDRLARVLTDMGASRREPLQFEISTAGDTIDGYGRKQYEYGRAVEAGTIYDEQFFFKAYEAPQDATDEQICSDPEIWKAANPSWGETVHEVEFRGALERAKRSPEDWAAFKQRRLNIWQKAANPWFRSGAWAACYRDLSVDQFEARGGGVGMDLARVEDLSAAVFVLPHEDGYVQLPHFWLPESRVADLSHLVSYQAWADEGFVTITEGEVTNFAVIERDLIELIQHFRSKLIAFDPMFAEELTQRLVQQTGIERLEFPQKTDHYAEPTADYERLLLDRKLWHPGNKCLDWQAGHVMCKVFDEKKKPVKDIRQPHKAIDGIQAGIMGLKAAMEAANVTDSVYARRGVLTI